MIALFLVYTALMVPYSLAFEEAVRSVCVCVCDGERERDSERERERERERRERGRE